MHIFFGGAKYLGRWLYEIVGANALVRPCHYYNRYTSNRVSPLRVSQR